MIVALPGLFSYLFSNNNNNNNNNKKKKKKKKLYRTSPPSPVVDLKIISQIYFSYIFLPKLHKRFH